MRGMILGAIGLAALATGAKAQTFDSGAEAWEVAARNGVTPDEWEILNVSAKSTTFVKKPAGRALETTRWVAFFYADDLTVGMVRLQADCRTGAYTTIQTNMRDWRGASLGATGPTAGELPAPGTVGEAIVNNLCPAVIVPGPPITLPIEPTRKEDRVEYVPRN